MTSPLTELLGQLQGSQLDRIAGQLGLDRSSTERAVGLAAPMLFGALAKNAAQPEGASSLLGALDRDHDGSVLDDLAGFLGGASASSGFGGGDGILGHIFGDRQGGATERLGRASGLDAATAGRLLAMLAPLVLGALGRSRRRGSFDPGDLAGMLGAERDRAASALPPGLGGLASLIDADGDGDVMDDLTRLGGGLLGGLLRGGR